MRSLWRPKPTRAGPYLSGNCFSNFILWRYAASVTLTVAAKEPGHSVRGGFTFRPRRSASPHESVKHDDSTSKDRRSVADTVSHRSSVRVLGGFTSEQWFVNLPVRSQLVRCCHTAKARSVKRLRNAVSTRGQPTYKSTTKTEATREEQRLREQDAPSIPMMSLR